MKQNRVVDFAQKIRERVSAAAAKRLARAALAVCLVAGCAALSATAVSAEGTRDIVRTSRENYAAVKNVSLPSNTAEQTYSFQTYDGWDGNIARWCFRAQDDSFVGVNRQQKVKFYANEGETIYIGSSSDNDTKDIVITLPDGTTQNVNLTETSGAILTKAEELAGPEGVYLDGKLVGEEGYKPYSFKAEQNGMYMVTLYAANESGITVNTDGTKSDVSKSTLEKTSFEKGKDTIVYAWDVTVTRTEDGKQVAIPGRVWMDALATEIDGGSGMYGYLYAVSRDGYIWRFGLNGIRPYTFAMYANTRGNISSVTNASSYHSVHSPIDNYTAFDFYKNLKDKYGNPDGVYLLGPDNDETDIDMPCHMFLNEPDTNIPDTIVKTTAENPGTLKTIRYDGSDVEDEAAGSGGDEKKNNLGFVGVDGYFEIETENASSYRIIIDMSNMYAISYHGENDSEHNTSNIHDDEICLGAGDTKDGVIDDGIDPNNFIYHDSANQWYAIRTIKQTGGKWDHHPTNEIPASGTASEDDFSNIIKIVPIERPREYNKDGEDFTTKDGKVYKCLGKVLLGNAAVSGKTDRIRWNGRDQYGRALPVGWYFGTTGRGQIYAQIKAGEVHFPLCDVENMPNGVSVKLMNPIDDNVSVDKISKIYYNNEDKSLLHEYPATVPNSKNGRISWIWNLPQGSNSKAGQTTTNAGKSDWRTTGAVFENYSIDGIASIVEADGVEKMTNNASKFQDGTTNNGDTGSDHGVVDVWTHVIDPEQHKLNDTIYLYHISDQMIVQGFVFFDGNTPGGDSKYDLSGNDTALYNATVVAEWGAVTSASLEKYNTSKDPTVLEFQKNGKNTYGYYKTSTNTDGIYSIPIDTTLFQVQGKATDYVANTEHYVRITVTYEDEHTGKASITTHKVTTASEKAAQKIEEKPNVSVQIVSVKSSYTNLKEINAEQVGYAIMPTTNPLRIRKIWTPDQLRDPSMTSTFTIKGILANDATSGEVPEKDKAFDDPAKIVFTLENVSVDENLGGIVDITSLPQYGYTIDADKHFSSDVVPNNVVSATGLQKIIYRVEENLKKESDSAIAPDILHDSNYNLEGTTGGAGTTVTTFDYWQFTNTIETSSLTVKVWYDEDNDGTFDTGEDSYLENAEITMGVKDPSSGELEGFKTFPGYKPGEEYKLDPVIIEPDKVNNTDKDGTFEFSGIGAGVYNVTVKFPTADNYNTYWENGVTYKADGDVKRMIFNKGVQQNIVISEFTVGSGDNGVLEIRVGGFEDVMSLGDKFTIKKQFTSNAVDKIPQGSAEFGLKIQTHGDEGAMNDVSEGTATATVDSGAISGDSINPVDFDLSDFKAKITSTESVLHLSEKTDSGEAGYIAGVDYDESEYEITVKATNIPGDGGLNPTTTYTISEVKKVKDKDGKEVDEKIELTGDKYNITFKNDYSVGRLTIKIGETEGESVDRNAKFGISLTPVGAALAGKTYKYQVFNSDNSTVGGENTLTFVDGVLKVCDLTEKQYVVIYDLPLGVSLTVGESLADGYILKEKKIDDTISTDNNVEIKATAAEDGLNNRTVEFINLHKEGSLSITKTVSVKDPTKDPDFTFNITIEKPSAAAISALSIANSVKKSYNVASPLMTKSTISAPAPIAASGFDYSLTLKVTDSEGEVTGSPTSVKFTDGGATVKLKDGQTATISGLPEGYSYKVVEADMPAGYVEAGKANDSGKIVYNDTAAATFTNNFETGELSITNTTTDNSTGEYTYTIALTAPDGVDFAESYTYTVGGDERTLTVGAGGKAELKLKGGETALIKGLPAGTHFEITETPASGYVLTYVTVDGAEDADKTANGTIPDGSEIAAHFRNSPVVTVTISGTKQIEGIRDWSSALDSGKYSFTIAATGESAKYLPTTKTVQNSDHEVKFGEITYDKPGTYTYSVSEEDMPAAVGGVSKDESVWEVTVTVSIDSATHALKVDSVNYSKTGVASAGEFTFTNKYTAEAAELTNDQKAQLKITKNLTGPISAKTNLEYSFTVTRKSAPAGASATTYSGETVNITVGEKDGLYTGEGNINLEDEYTYPGEYVYEVSENSGAASGVTYDSTKYTVTVVVSDNNRGELSVASVTITGGKNDGNIVFNNTYSVDPVTATDFDINKTLKLGTEKFSGQFVNFPEEFKFKAVIKKDGAEVSDGTAGWEVGGTLSSSQELTISQTAGEVGRGATTVLGPKFTAAGTYVLEITEQNPTDSHITKDGRTLTVTYTVTDVGGKLEVTSTSTDDLTFNNMYEPEKTGVTVNVKKRLINTVTNVDLLDNTDGLGVEAYNGKFSFKLEKADENPGATINDSTATNEWGDVDFGGNAITFDRAGTFKFKITETSSGSVIEGEPEITTSKEEIYVVYVVTVDEDGELTVGAPTYYKNGTEPKDMLKSADEAFFKNTYGPVPCVLTISKEIETEPGGIAIDQNQTFTFEIKLEDGSAVAGTIQKAIDEEKIFYVFQPAGGIMTTALERSGEGGRITVHDSTFEIELKAGQSVQIQGIPYLTSYAVTEKDLPAGYTISEITHDKTTESNPTSDYSVAGDFTKEQDKTNVKFTNLYTLEAGGDTLPELKKVLSGRALVDGEFSFTATIDSTNNGAVFSSNGETELTVRNSADGKITLGNINFTKPGTYKVTVKEKVDMTIGDVEFDDKEIVITYTVTDEDSTGRKDGVLRVSGPVIADGDGESDNDLTFENVFETGSLSITNTTTDNSTYEYTFEITLTAPDGVTLAESYAYTVNDVEQSEPLKVDGNVITLTLKGGETAVIKGLPAGTTFEITETPASGYVLTYVEVDGAEDADKTANGTIPNGSEIAAHLWNSPTVTVTISGTKEISGIRKWDDTLDSGKYSFTITAGAGTDEAYLPEIKTVKNVGQSITFDEITYDKPGTYTYSVSEEDVPAAVGGVSKDESVWTVTVTVVTDSDHALKADSVNYSKTGVASAGEFTFTNKYTAEAAELTNDQKAQLKITKNLTGPISAKTNLEYEFTVTRMEFSNGPEGVVPPDYRGETVNITVGEKDGLYIGEGNIKLENEYIYPGEYAYEVSENSGAASGITYDSTKYTVTVVVEDNKDGTLSVKSVDITGDKNDGKIVFNNEYSVEPVEADDFEIEKTLKLDAVKFSGQSVNFPEDFNFNAVIKKNGAEVTDGTAGWEVDGALSSSTKLTISQTAGEVGRGTTTVLGPKFTATGTYVLEITEENPTDSHIAKDGRTLTVTYTVADVGGMLEVEASMPSDLTFNNIYEPSPVSRTVSVKKKLINTVTDVDLLDDSLGHGVTAYKEAFSFKLEKADENPGAEVKVDSVNNNWGDVVFTDSSNPESITFDRAGTFKFKITETSSGSVIEGEPEITTSTEEIYVEYEVSVDENGKLTVGAPTYTKKVDSESAETSITEAEAFFTNTYGPVPCVLTISKEITTNPDGIAIDRDQTFTFRITLEDGGAVAGTIQKAIDEGKIFYVYQPAGGIMTTALERSGEGGRITVNSATFEIELKAGQSAQIQGIPYLTRYTVTEKDLPDGYSISGVTHDGATENNPVEGAFGSIEDDSTEVNFTNLYTLNPAEATLPELTKVLSGRALVDGEFSFTATIDSTNNGAVFSSNESTELTVQNSADGKITLGNINFTKPGTYKVTVKENVDMTLGDVVFDDKEIVITYKVTDNKNGTLRVSGPVVVDNDGKSDNDSTFENVFKTGDLSITNTTTDNSAGEYTYTIALTAPSGVDFAESYTYTIGETDYNLTVDSDGKAELKLNGSETAVIKGLPAGTTFEITEAPASGYVLTYVEVGGAEDADKTANGTIPNGSGIAAQFRNSPKVTQIISGTKEISGIRKWDDSLDNEVYSFTITAGAGTDEAYLPETTTVNNDKTSITFAEITYDQAGIYTYTVSEDNAAMPGGITRDESVWTVTVTVSIDSTSHALTKSVKYECDGESNTSGFTFTNTYTAKATAEPQTLEITKKIATNEGINPAAEVYRFEAERVLPAGDEFSKTYTISMAAGELEKSAEIELETYTEPGEYVYEIAEIAGGTVGMTYDSGRFKVTVEVSDDSVGGLHSEIKSIEKIGEGEVADVVFENKFATGTLEITKKTRGLGVDPLEEFKFTISLKDENGEPLSGEYGYTTEGLGFRPFGPAPFALANLNVVSDGSEISLKAGDTVKIVGLPVGAVYTVSEEDAGGYSVFVSTNSGAEVESASASGIIVDGTTSLVFVNEKQKQFEFKQFAFKNEIYPGDGESVEPGDEIIYELGWQNPTLKEATIVITDKLDNHVEYVDTGDERLSYDPGTHTVTATVEAGPLKSGTLELTVRVKAGAHGDIENKATATVDGTEYECETEEIKNPVAGITVEKAQSLNGGEKTDSLVEARRGDVITYYLTVTANSEDPSAVEKNVTVKDIIPEGLSVVAGSVSDGGEIDENGLMSWNLGELAAGESVTVSYSVEIPQVSKDSTWSGKGYVYAGEDPAENEPDDSKIGEEGYHWKASEELSAHAVGDLVLTKRVVSTDGSSIPFGVEFDFTIELSLNGEPLAGGYVYETTSGASGAVFDGKLETELADGESVTIKSLPAGVEYRITESPVVNYQSDKTDNIDFGAVLNTANEVIFTNDYSFVAAEVGGLTVTNVVIGEPEDLEKTFTFTVTLLDGGINGTYGEMTFIDGVATFTLSNGMSIEARGLPSHIGYTVSEAEANAEGFTTQSVNAEGAIPVGTSADAVFTNFKRASASGKLVIRSTVDGTIQDEAASYGFTVTLDDPGVNGLYGDLFFENGVARAAIVGSSSVSASGLPAGAGYSVVFDGAFGGGISVSAHNDVGAIPAGGTATADFVIRRELGNLTVMKTVSGEAPLAPQEYGFTVTLDDFNINGTYGEMTFIGGTASFSLSGGQSATAYGLPAGVGYSVSEEPGAGYTVSASGNIGVIPQSATATASFINAYAAPLSLTITKATVGKPAELPFDFRVTLTPPAGESLDSVAGIMLDEFGAGVIQIYGGQSAIISGIPEGTQYTVEELYSGTEFNTEPAKSGIISAAGEAVTFVNTRKVGSLTVRNTIVGTAADQNRAFNFTVTLSDPSINGRFGDMTFVGGTASFALSGGQNVTASDLPAGTGFTVYETDAGADGYTATVFGLPAESGYSGFIAENADSAVEFINEKNGAPALGGSLTVINNVIGTTTDELFTFTVRFTDLSGNIVFQNAPAAIGFAPFAATSGEPVYNPDGTVTVSLRHGESQTFTGLPAETLYEVVETRNLYYSVTSITPQGLIPDGSMAVAVFNNRWNAGGLDISVKVENDLGAILDYDESEYEFTVTLSDFDGSTLSGFVYPSHIPASGWGETDADVLMSFDENGVATFTLKNGQSASAPDLPGGIGYTIEAVSKDGRYIGKISGTNTEIASGNTVASENASEDFTFIIRTGSIKITKTLLNYYGELLDSKRVGFEFEVKLVAPDGSVLKGAYVYSDGEHRGAIESGDKVTVYNEEPLTISGIPEGTSYEIIEESKQGYMITEKTGIEGTVSVGATAEVGYTNKIAGMIPPVPADQKDPDDDKPSGGGGGGGTEPDEPEDPDDGQTEVIPGDDIIIDRPTEGAFAAEDPASAVKRAAAKGAFPAALGLAALVLSRRLRAK